MEIILNDLPKISLNKWYSSTHWTHRQNIKNDYAWIIKDQFKEVFSKKGSYIVDYKFTFKSKPLDASNCAAMVKLIEDVIFEDDNYKIIDTITIQSKKGKKDSVYIEIIELNSIN